jgi:glutamyl/glutaminyl-tRNA synthetase
MTTTRFAPAPTGLLHLGHVVNAIHVWGLAATAGAAVVLRIEDHDRQRSRAEFERALLDDLEWLGFIPDRPAFDDLRSGLPSPYRQSDSGLAYEAALGTLRAAVPVYACDCSRTTFDAWERANGTAWRGPGCPGGCVGRRLSGAGRSLSGRGRSLRAAIGEGVETWDDVLLGGRAAEVARRGDLVVRDRLGNWTYAFSVVVDDIRHGIDVVVRGADLVDETARQIRLGRLLGRTDPPSFGHHPLVLGDDGAKLSKSAGDTGVRELRAAGRTPEEVIGAAAAAIGLAPEGTRVRAADAAALLVARAAQAPAAFAAARGG